MPVVFDAPPKSGVVFDPMADAIADPTGGAEQRLREKEAVGVRTQVRKEEDNFVKQNAESGIPIRPRKALDAGIRARLSAEPDPAVQAKMLADRGIPARVSKDGKNVLARVKGDDGKDEDVPLHPFGGVTAGSVAGAAFPLAKLGANIGVGIASGGMSLIPAAATMGLGALATEALTTGGSRIASGQPLADTGERALTEGTVNAAFPLAIGAVGATAKGARALIARKPSILAQNFAGASERTGVPGFPSQTTDSTVLARAEEAAGLKKLKAEQQGSLRTAFDRELGPSGSGGVLSESEIAKKVQPILATDAEVAERGARITMTDAEREAQRELTAQLDAGIIPAGASNTAVAQNTRTKFEDFVTKVKKDAETNYPIFYKKAEDEGIELSKDSITNLVKEIEKKDPAGVAEFLAPSIKQVKAVEQKLTKPLAQAGPTGEVDDAGKAIMTEEIPAPPLTFDQAIRQRAILRQKINAPDDPLGDVVKSYYKQLEKAYTEAIDDGLKRGSPELRTLYETARGSYAEGADALERGVVQRLFREAGEAGRVPDERVVSQLFEGGGKLEALRDMKNILGADSADYKLLLRQGLQNMIDDAGQKGTGGLIDVQSFLTKVNAMGKEMSAEVLGPLEAPLKATAQALSIASKGPKSAALIPADELADALAASPARVKLLIERAVQRQQAYESEYIAGIMGQMTGGRMGIKALGNLDTFVTDFVPKASAADMRQILTQVDAASPGSADQIRQRVLANIRRDVTATKATGTKTTNETFDLSPEAIAKYTDGPEAEKYRAILGNRVMQFLDDMATIAESNALRIERGAKEGVTPRVFGKEAISGAAGFLRNAISTGIDLATILPRAIVGNAERLKVVRDFLTTGAFPTLRPAATGAIRTTPGALREAGQVLSDEQTARPMPLAK